MKYRLILSRDVRLILGLLCVAAGIAIAYWGQYYGIDLSDSPYMFFNVREPERGPVAMLTFMIGNGWCRIFGFSIQSLNLLRALCNVATFGIGCLYFALVTRRYFRASVMFMALCGLGEICFHHFFNWDTGVYPWFALNAVLVLHYLHRPSPGAIIMMGISLAILTLARVPALTCGLIDAGAVIYRYHGNRDKYAAARLTGDILTGILSFSITAVAVIILMTGSVSAYIDSYRPENLITGHFDFQSIYYRLMLFIPVTVAWGCTLVLIGAAYWAVVTHTQTWLKVAAVALGYIICWNGIRIVTTSPDTQIDAGLGQILFIVALITVWQQHDRPPGKTDTARASVVVLASFAVSAIIGSDTVAERLMGLPLLAPALAFIDYRDSAVRRTINILLATLSMMGIYRQAYILYNSSKENNGLYYHITGFPAVGEQFTPIENAGLIEWARNALPADRLLKSSGYAIGYTGEAMMLSEMLLGNSNPAWMHDFHIYVDDPEQSDRINRSYAMKDCVIFPTDFESTGPTYLLLQKFLNDYHYTVISMPGGYSVAIRPDKAEEIKSLLEQLPD